MKLHEYQAKEIFRQRGIVVPDGGVATTGRPGDQTGDLTAASTFNLQELKGPIIQAVTAAGWVWQPVVWNAPAPFRWLTE